MTARRLISLLAALAALWLPAAADAATATLAYEEPVPALGIQAAYSLSVRAAGGEANRITVQQGDQGYTVLDTAGVRAGAGCTSLTSVQAHCRTSQPATDRSVFIDGGDGDDRLVVRSLEVTTATELRGGSGRDRLFGGEGHDLLLGGSGPDSMLGNAGFDRLDGGRGDDLMHGSSGRDRVSYERRRRSVTVDLARGAGGQRGEDDFLEEIEEVVGGRGADRLLGTSGPDTLLGGPGGRDRVNGRRGADIVIGRRAVGGAGADSLDGRVLSCGRGRDTLYRGRHRAPGPFPRSCERLVAVFVVLRPQPIRTRRRSAVFGVRCHDARRCRGTLTVRDRRGVLGAARFSLRRGKAGGLRRVRVNFSRRPARRVARLRVEGVRAYQRSSFRVRVR